MNKRLKKKLYNRVGFKKYKIFNKIMGCIRQCTTLHVNGYEVHVIATLPFPFNYYIVLEEGFWNEYKTEK